jgi:hypothetical protein
MAVKTTKENNIEQGSSDAPKLGAIMDELEQAQADTNSYWQRLDNARKWWRSWWPGQTIDGRKHSDVQPDCEPWDNAADARMRTVETLIRDHVRVAKFSFFKAKLQARSVRPLVQAKRSQRTTELLRWQIYNHMWAEACNVLPVAWSWRYGNGLGLLGVEWEQSRRMEYHDLTIPDLVQVVQAQGGPDMMLELLDAFHDPDQEDDLVKMIQGFSPVLDTTHARKIVRDLRDVAHAELPIAYPYINRPRWTALRPCVDVLFPAETSDIQEARWVARREWVTETELMDRIETDGYDPGFVDEVLKHKGESTLNMESMAVTSQRSGVGNYGTSLNYQKLVEIYRFTYKTTMEGGTPCMYETVFNSSLAAKGRTEQLYAKHGPHAYQHGQYPVVVMRRTKEDLPILESIGLAEEAYTDEQALKEQLDGITNRTAMVLRPPLIVPHNKVKAVRGERFPGSVLGVSRPNEFNWMPLPPVDATPVKVFEMVQNRLSNRYPLFGLDVDPEAKQLYRDEIATEILSEMELVIEQTLQLDQQFISDDQVVAVISQLGQEFKAGREDIQGKYEISMTIDVRMLDQDYAENKLQMIGQAMAFKQEGMLFRMAIEAIDPDAADQIADDQVSPAANEKEKQDELNAISAAFNGIEWPLPMQGNHQLRLETLMENTIQSPNPLMQHRLQAAPDTQKILENRAKFFQRQMQQYQQNPDIGRALATSAFQPGMAPQLTGGSGMAAAQGDAMGQGNGAMG